MKKIATALTKPSASSKLWAMWIWNGKISSDGVKNQLNELIEKGFGGVAIRPSVDMQPGYLSEEYFDLFQEVLESAKASGIKVRIADDFSMCHGGFFHNAAIKNSSLRAGKLVLKEVLDVPGQEKFSYTTEGADKEIILAAKVINNRIDIASVKKLVPAAKSNAISWKATSGDWKVLILKKDWQLDPYGNYVPNVFNAKTSQLYIQDVLGEYTSRFSKYVSNTLEGFINEMPAMLPGNVSIPWDDDLVTKYKSRYKKDLVSILPSLFLKVNDKYASNRGHVFNFISQALTERFAGSLETWASKNKMSQWVLAAERDPALQNSQLTDALAVINGDLSSVGIQNQEGTDKNYGILKAVADANALEYKRETIGVVGRNRKDAGSSVQGLKNEIEKHATLGTSKIIVDGCFFNMSHRSFIKTAFNPFWYHSEWDKMKALCEYSERLLSLADTMQKSSDVAVLLPSASAMADYLPSDSGDFKKAIFAFTKTIDAMNAANIEFDVVTESFISSCSIKANGEFGPTTKVRKGSYKAIVVPYSRLIANSTFVFLEKLAIKKGSVFFIDEAPMGNFDDGQSDSFESRVSKILRSKGKCVYVSSPDDISVNLDIKPVVSVTSNGKPCSDIFTTVGSEQGGTLAILTNEDNRRDSFTTVEVEDHKYVYLLDLETGLILDFLEKENIDNSVLVNLTLLPKQTVALLATTAKATGVSVKESKTHPINLWGSTEKGYSVVLKDKWTFTSDSLNALPLASWKMRIGLSRELGGFSHYYESYFEVEELPETCLLAFMDSGSGSSVGDFSDLEISVNGSIANIYKPEEIEGSEEISENDKGIKEFYDGAIVKYDIKNAVVKGVNRISIRTVGVSVDPASVVYPAMVVGNFSVAKGQRGWKICNSEVEAAYGSWSKSGYPFLSGKGSYSHIFEVPSDYKRVLLRFGEVSGGVEVNINENDLEPLSWQPLCYDITKIVEQRRNRLNITVANNPDNILRMAAAPSGIISEVFLDIYS